jgi:hypothetical protein
MRPFSVRTIRFAQTSINYTPKCRPLSSRNTQRLTTQNARGTAENPHMIDMRMMFFPSFSTAVVHAGWWFLEAAV